MGMLDLLPTVDCRDLRCPESDIQIKERIMEPKKHSIFPAFLMAFLGLGEKSELMPPIQGKVIVKRHGRHVWHEIETVAPKQQVRNFNGMSAWKQFKPLHPGHTGR
jgi:hypothetical protein